ncbi:polysaccharide pyruvyl transferase family protein, partial [bacterium]|nr:polysaccharide pyruvyl transferase family protein [bacterium]
MERITILNTWVTSTNLGNKIIMESVYKELREIFPHSFFYQVSAIEYVKAGRKLVQQADYVFLGGTNVISSDMNRTSEWRLRMTDLFWMKKVILLGLGWWQYQAYTPNLYTRILLSQILRREYYHSVRDSYTADKLKALGFRVLNTGCPTLWNLSKEH